MDAVLVTSNLAMGEALSIAARGYALTIAVTDASADRPLADTPVVILDLLNDDAAVLARTIDHAGHHDGRTLVLSCGSDPGVGDLEVDGWISADATMDELAAAVTDTRRAATSARTVGRVAPAEALTSRERAVLAELLAGHDNEVVATRLDISEHTVRTHVQNILTKLGVSSRAEAMSWALRTGAVRPVQVQEAAS